MRRTEVHASELCLKSGGLDGRLPPKGRFLSMEAKRSANAACFGPFRLELKAGELYKGSRRIRLQEQPFLVLKMLLERPRDVVTREEIRKALWPNDTVVEF